MGDIKLFKIKDKVEEIEETSTQQEKNIQGIVEENMEVLLGVKFLATEYSTGKVYNGRIDSIGIDTNNSPVIIKYKRLADENIINQGLYYLDWILDHIAEFKLLVMDKLGIDASKNIECSTHRLICIADDFTKYDIHAVNQINRNIELIKFKNYKEEILLLEMVHTNIANNDTYHVEDKIYNKKTYNINKTQDDNDELISRFYALREFIISLGDDVQEKKLSKYFIFMRIKNFACVELQRNTNTVLIYTKASLDEVEFKDGFTRDATNVGHFGSGNLEIRFTDMNQFEEVKNYIISSYNAN